ncbi:SMI1/KNR4 family protein [Rubritalea tangerina]|uniref:SMI1/KNR4 family protein n=1 Tax=Rubritalea tangerina TaxID=430798 RepID=A0ABW4ZDC0_9BACT
MKTWSELITEFHEEGHSGDLDSKVLGVAASDADLSKFGDDLGRDLGTEFKSFYSAHNGYGIQSDDGIDWFIVPLDQIKKITNDAVDWFQETHTDLAERFVAIADWDCGDYSGFLFSEDGSLMDGFYTFEHESYEFDEDQNWSEFLIPIDSSLRDFLTT